jgi:hypothetical protein
MRVSTTVVAAVTVAVAGAMGMMAMAQTGAAPPAKIRVGAYDNRAIAVAYAASEFNSIRDKMKQYEAAQKAGDQSKMAELEAWGKARQRALYFQGFGRAPVADILEVVKDGVARVAKDRQAAVITSDCDFAASEVEVVDVTDDLIELFHPTAKTRETARQLRKTAPKSLVELADLPAEG